jgi:hypothetical protein
MRIIDEAVKSFFDNKYNDLRKVVEPTEIKRQEFTKQFPPNQIFNMQLDDYVVGKEKESFCYWLETTLRPLGSIKGGSTADKKFGVYYNKENKEYRTIQKWDKDDNPEVAFSNIKIEISKLLIAGKNDDMDGIISNRISPMFKHKILTTYFPDKYLSVFSEAHVDYFLKKMNIPSNNNLHVEDKRRILFEYKNTIDKFKNVDNYYFTAFLYWWNNPKVKDIRLLPMSASKEFPTMTYEELQSQFFNDELISEREGHYHFPEKGMNAGKGTLVLFQFNGQIIASAKLLEVKKYNEPLYVRYTGSYVFDTKSIKTFEPITADELREIDDSFKNFSQSKQHIDSSCYEAIMELIQLKSSTVIPEEIPAEQVGKFSEGSKKEITVNAYERNPKARQECIRIHGSKCVVCGFDFGQTYGEEFIGKIHVHHKKPLAEIDDEYEVDPVEDLVPVCPNCHMILHSKKEVYTIEEVKEFLIQN